MCSFPRKVPILSYLLILAHSLSLSPLLSVSILSILSSLSPLSILLHLLFSLVIFVNTQRNTRTFNENKMAYTLPPLPYAYDVRTHISNPNSRKEEEELMKGLGTRHLQTNHGNPPPKTPPNLHH